MATQKGDSVCSWWMTRQMTEGTLLSQIPDLFPLINHFGAVGVVLQKKYNLKFNLVLPEGEAELDPMGIAVTENGQLLVLDYSKGDVLVFDEHGQYVKSFLATPKSLRSPVGIMVDETDGNVYVVEFSRRRVTCFNKDGECIRNFGSSILQAPYGVTLDKNRNFLVLDSEEAIHWFCPQGKHLKTVSTKDEGAKREGWPIGIQVDKMTGDIVVFDGQENQSAIKRFDSEGTFKSKLVHPDLPQDHMHAGYVDAFGKIVVSDVKSVLVFDGQLTELLFQFDLPSGYEIKQCGGCYGLLQDKNGNLWVSSDGRVVGVG